MKQLTFTDATNNVFNYKQGIEYIKSHWRELGEPDAHGDGIVCPICGAGNGDETMHTKSGIRQGVVASSRIKGNLICYDDACAFHGFRPKRDPLTGEPLTKGSGGTIIDLYMLDLMLKDDCDIDEIEAMTDDDFKSFSKPYFKQSLQYCATRLDIVLDRNAQDRVDLIETEDAPPRAIEDFTEFYKQARADFYANEDAQQYIEKQRALIIEPDEIDNYNDSRDSFYFGYCANWISPTARWKYETGQRPNAPTGIDVVIIPVSKNYFVARAIGENATSKNLNELGGGNISLWHEHGFVPTGDAPTFNAFSFKGNHIVYVCEGAINAMSLCQFGVCAVATNGAGNYRLYVDALLQYGEKDVLTVICYDNDKSGQSAAKQMQDALTKHNLQSIRVNLAGDHNDINDALVYDADGLSARFECLNSILCGNVAQNRYLIDRAQLFANLGKFGAMLTDYDPQANENNATSHWKIHIDAINERVALDDLTRHPDDATPLETKQKIACNEIIGELKAYIALQKSFKSWKSGNDFNDTQIDFLITHFDFDPDTETLETFFDRMAMTDEKANAPLPDYVRIVDENTANDADGGADPTETPTNTGAQNTLNDQPVQDRFDLFKSFKSKIKTNLFEPIPTGFEAIDTVLAGGLTRKQLVLLLGAPSIGKTTLAHQIFETAARHGHEVIYLNLEMSRDQLFAKSISRLAFAHGEPMTALEIMRNKQTTGAPLTDTQNSVLDACLTEYEHELLPHIEINPKMCANDADANDIVKIKAFLDKIGNQYKAQNKPAPIVCLDYLQYVRKQGTDDPKTIANETMQAFKSYAENYDTISFIISAVKRDSMAGGMISLNSGRDTSAIEYTADVQITINYTCLQLGKLGKAPNNATYTYLSKQEPRNVCMQLLKGRFTPVYTVAYLQYYPAQDTFRPIKPDAKYYKLLKNEANACNDVTDKRTIDPQMQDDTTETASTDSTTATKTSKTGAKKSPIDAID